MAFRNVRMSEVIEQGAEYGPKFNTVLQRTTGGKEKRVALWEEPKYEGNIATGLQDQTLIEAGLAFFHMVRGQADTFRFKDFADFTATTQNLGAGNGSQTAFTIRKAYVSGGVTRYRTHLLPVSGTVHVFLDGVEQMSGWSVDYSTGILTFSVAPLNAVVVTATFEFDNHVRFGTDHWPVNLTQVEVGQVQDIPIVELDIDR